MAEQHGIDIRISCITTIKQDLAPPLVIINRIWRKLEAQAGHRALLKAARATMCGGA